MTRLKVTGTYLDCLIATDFDGSSVTNWVRGQLARDVAWAQTAVYRNGEMVVSVAGGRDHVSRPVSRSTLACLYSSTKLFSSLAALAAVDRGYFELDSPVCRYWPEFAANNKEEITIRHVLTHRAGIRLGPPGTSWGWWGERTRLNRWIEATSPEWTPGTDVGYHNRVWGFVLDELFKRTTGEALGEFFDGQVVRALGMHDFRFGISRENYDTRLAKTLPPADGAPHRTDPQVQADPEFRTKIGDELNMFNSFEVLHLPLPWGTAIATAETAADLANVLALGGAHRGLRLFSRELFQESLTETCADGELDRTLGGEAHWGLGLQLGLFPTLASSGVTAGHRGGSTVHVWVDTSLGISAAAIVGSTPGSAAAGEAWRNAFAEAVYQDLSR